MRRGAKTPAAPAPSDDPAPEPVSPPAWLGRAWIAVVWLFVAGLHTAAFPPFDLPESAYVFAVPAVLWALRTPRWKTWLWTTGSACLVSWLVILEWLRTLTEQAGPIALLGWAGLAAVVAIFHFAWFAALRRALPRSAALDTLGRCTVVLGLAGAWVVLEWIRGWLFTGFPWLPLAASQWQRPVMLQGAAYGGAWAISGALVLFNLGLGVYLERMYRWVKERRSRICVEFYLGLVGLFVVSFGLYGDSVGQQREILFRAGALQPHIPQSVKWDPAEAQDILEILESETEMLSLLQPDAIFWPEAVTPVPLAGVLRMQRWVEELAARMERPIVLGSVGYEELPPEADGGLPRDRWTNGLFVVDPVTALDDRSYAKRHLVPFGEYVPMRRILPFLEKLVPVGGDFSPGESAAPLLVRTPNRTTQVGGLICYEDVFPGLARGAVREGAQVLFVATNNAWFGEGGAAFQHAAHSVLRAVETRRPVLRVGNAGWSGWIDEYGNIRDRMFDDRGSIYHRGSAVFVVSRDRRWSGRESVYVRRGDWFVAASALLVVLGWLAVRRASDRPGMVLES
ncbi:apolipoprotein N-acyltransferase [Opitutales bacterium ASA1]|uniref:apolipoprotein N-acyltransferase n=1 Tax=Congregicoccus parvus TaxID=3081749 RepID=UPI002B2EDB07|nr:apolipoprotein N-acyltransferase [Opitutales bacterium ASA1]